MSKISLDLKTLESVDVQLEQVLVRQATIDPYYWLGDDTAAVVDDVFVVLSETSREISETVDSFVTYLKDVAAEFSKTDKDLGELFTSFDFQSSSGDSKQGGRQSKYYDQII